MNQTTFTVGEDKKTLVVERTFPAARSKVWAAWTTPELFVKWWGPQGWKTTVNHMDFTDGGYLLYVMKCEDPAQGDFYGQTSSGKSTYRNIKAENSFEYIDEFTDEAGNVLPGMPALDISLQFSGDGDETKVVSTTVFAKPEDLEQVIAMGMEEGLKQTWDRLEELLA